MVARAVTPDTPQVVPMTARSGKLDTPLSATANRPPPARFDAAARMSGRS